MSFAMIDQMDTITHTLRAMSTMIVHYVIPLDWLQEHLMHRFLKSQSIHTWCWVVVVGGGGGCGVCVWGGGTLTKTARSTLSVLPYSTKNTVACSSLHSVTFAS